MPLLTAPVVETLTRWTIPDQNIIIPVRLPFGVTDILLVHHAGRTLLAERYCWLPCFWALVVQMVQTVY